MYIGFKHLIQPPLKLGTIKIAILYFCYKEHNRKSLKVWNKDLFYVFERNLMFLPLLHLFDQIKTLIL